MTESPELEALLEWTRHAGASDLHLRAGRPPVVRVDGRLIPGKGVALTNEMVDGMVDSMLPEHLRVAFKETHEADFAFGDSRLGRFRANAFRQRGLTTVAIRALREPSGNLTDLGLPAVLERLAGEPRGMILVTGPTGAGKTTTLAAVVDLINRTRACNIITIEDPIEILHEDKMAMVSQREVGVDTAGFAEALRRVLRQDPDVILVGEMRDMATVDAALTAAETGHLVLSTLHTLDAVETVNRILDFFPNDLQRQVRLLLAGSLRAVISQRLLRRADEKGMVPAVEVLINTERAAERIADPGQTSSLHEVIAEGGYYGMVTFDQSILQLLERQDITFTEAMRHATRPSDLKVTAQRMGLVPT
ncbi:MAG: PilT/PilU family type 4a pilus ATPase [Actinobacteria bacterium]|nr:PilT/PilU family type 4a pilus ATPase [Actinomycetota bacterium]MBU1493188.1 PilT/PilU family type 4a pilus ATPase [Actinomycetota bacterium]MBU1865636.1 PilT/PilU family type 4a pilus ATPase [Actinomycetota bacterium]